MNKNLRLALIAVAALVGVVASFALVLVILQSTATASGPPLDGCVKGETSEMYAVDRYNCTDGTDIITFNNNDGRDQYRKIAETYGQQTVETGDKWLRVRN